MSATCRKTPIAHSSVRSHLCCCTPLNSSLMSFPRSRRRPNVKRHSFLSFGPCPPFYGLWLSKEIALGPQSAVLHLSPPPHISSPLLFSSFELWEVEGEEEKGRWTWQMPRVDRPAEKGGREARRTAQSFSLDVDKFPLAAREEEERPRRREEEKLEGGEQKEVWRG